MGDSLLRKTVEWSSSSNGRTYTKRGVVIYDGPKRYQIDADGWGKEYQSSWLSKSAWRELVNCSGSQDRTGYGRSANTGVLVRVTEIDGEALPKPLYYSPRRSALKVVAR